MRAAKLATVLAAALLSSAAAPAGVPAQEGGSLGILAPGAGQLVGLTSIPVIVEGRLAVEFSANPVTGCAAPCDKTGEIVWTPGREADLLIADSRVGGQIETEVSLTFLSFTAARPGTAARVTRAGAGICQDARGDRYSALDFTSTAPGTALVRFAGTEHAVATGGDLLSTRCGGPLERDIAPMLPGRSVPLAALRSGSSTIDLSRTAPFSGSGTAGVVRSSLVLRLGRPEVLDGRGLEGAAAELLTLGRGQEKFSLLTAVYEVESARGDLVGRFGGVTQPELCAPLDACGAQGTVRVSHAATKGEAFLVAMAPGRVTRRELAAALGLRRGKRARGIDVFGSIFWEKDAGRTSTSVTEPGGRVCSDSGPLSGALVSLAFTRRRVAAEYAPAGETYEGDPFRTRCPGPTSADASDGGRSLASGSLPLRAFRGKRVVISLDRGSTFATGAYAGRTDAALTITLRRVSVRSELFPVPAGAASRNLGRRVARAVASAHALLPAQRLSVPPPNSIRSSPPLQ